MAGTTLTDLVSKWRPSKTSHHDPGQKLGTPLRNELLPSDISLQTGSSSLNTLPSHLHSTTKHHYTQQQPPYHIIHHSEEMVSNRKFSYASVKEDIGEDIPQSFESSLSSSDIEEIEWIAWPCNHHCKVKGLCSRHAGGTHEEYVQSRLEGYARSNPRKLEKIINELEKRRSAQTLYNLAFASDILCCSRPTADFSLEVWREKVKHTAPTTIVHEIDEDALISEDEEEDVESANRHQLSPLETLPSEIQNLIFSYVTIDHTADPYARPHVDLCSCALVSKSLHEAAVRVMYEHVSIPQSRAFNKFTRSLDADPRLGQLVHWLDFSHYSSLGFGRSRSTTTRTPFLTPTTLKQCLDKTPLLQAFLVHEHVDDELDLAVVSKLFSMPFIQALDFTACSSKPFAEAFTAVSKSLGSVSHPLKRLSLHECTTLQEPVFEALLPCLSQLTHLDVAHTFINDKALLSIPATAEITHLNLERCTRLTGAAVVKFLTTHPATKSIVYLNLMADASRHRLLSESEVSQLLPKLPSSLRSLNLGGARINSDHVPELRRLACHLEELGLKGANLGLAADINRIFGLEKQENGEVVDCRHTTSIRYIDLTDVKSVTQMSLSYSPTALTSILTQPLEVIEVGSSVLEEIKKRNARVKSPEWIVREMGRRGWYVRQPLPQQPGAEPQKTDDGSRAWKMGSRWWGMRKVPMVNQDVGGMYGYFMFKRN